MRAPACSNDLVNIRCAINVLLMLYAFRNAQPILYGCVCCAICRKCLPNRHLNYFQAHVLLMLYAFSNAQPILYGCVCCAICRKCLPSRHLNYFQAPVYYLISLTCQVCILNNAHLNIRSNFGTVCAI